VTRGGRGEGGAARGLRAAAPGGGEALAFRISRQMLPYWSTFGWKHGVTKVTCGASYG
jgi:hypothetical protein